MRVESFRTEKKQPTSLRARLVTAVLICWILPVFGVMALAGYLLGSSYERSARQELESRMQNAMEQLQMRMDAVFEASKTVSYDGVVRNAYRLCQRDGDSAALYAAVTEYLTQNFTRDERIDAVFLSFWEETGVHPYAAGRGDFGFSAQRKYREQIVTGNFISPAICWTVTLTPMPRSCFCATGRICSSLSTSSRRSAGQNC